MGCGGEEGEESQLCPLLDESDELIAIFVKSTTTAKTRQPAPQSGNLNHSTNNPF